MALVVAAARPDTDSTVISLSFGSASGVIEQLGNKAHEGSTLNQLAAAGPSCLKRWAASKATALLSIEKRHFAKLVMACMKAGVHLGVDRQQLPDG